MKNTKIIAAAATLATASLALAAPVTVQYVGIGSGGNVKITTGSNTRDVFAGQIRHSISGAVGLESWMNGTQRTYCADLAQVVSSSAVTYNTAAVSALTSSSPMGSSKANAIRDMFVFAAGTQISSSASNDFATAFQLAVWEVINDFTTSEAGNGLSITAGNFKAKKTDGSALGSGIMSNLTALFAVAGTNLDATGLNISGLANSNSQDQIVSGLVPTPGVLALVGCGSLVAMRRRRN